LINKTSCLSYRVSDVDIKSKISDARLALHVQWIPDIRRMHSPALPFHIFTTFVIVRSSQQRVAGVLATFCGPQTTVNMERTVGLHRPRGASLQLRQMQVHGCVTCVCRVSSGCEVFRLSQCVRKVKFMKIMFNQQNEKTVILEMKH